MAYEYDLGSIKGPIGAVGPAGPAGQIGPPGPAPCISVGTVVTLDPGEDAAVRRRDGSPDEAPVLDFYIPKGEGGMDAAIYDPQHRSQDIFAYAEQFAGRATATFTVAAADSKNRELADYVCSGISDQLVINAALEGLPEAGGVVQLMEGTYRLDDAGSAEANGVTALIRMDKANVWLKGSGKATRLCLAAGAVSADGNVCMILGAAGGLSLSDLVLWGNSAANAGSVEGIRLQQGSMTLQSVEAADLSSSGFALAGNAAAVRGCVVLACRCGIQLSAAQADVADCTVSNCGTGIHALSGQACISRCRIGSSAECGVNYTAGPGEVVNNILIDQPVGMSFDGARDVIVFGNIIHRDAAGSLCAAGEETLLITASMRLMVIGNWLRGKAVSCDVDCQDTLLTLTGSDWNPTM